MNWLETIVWSFPILFMIHEFEELIMVNAWRQRNANKLKPLKRKPFGEPQSTAALSCGVLQEFMLVFIVSFMSVFYNHFIVFFGVFFAYTIHLILHIILPLKFKGYVPGIVTAVIQLPICVYVVWWLYMNIAITPMTAVLSSFIAMVVLFSNVLFLHHMMPKFDRWINNYTLNSN